MLKLSGEDQKPEGSFGTDSSSGTVIVSNLEPLERTSQEGKEGFSPADCDEGEGMDRVLYDQRLNVNHCFKNEFLHLVS